MKLIINIPDEYFEQIKNNTEGSTAESEAIYAIRNGISYEERSQGVWYYNCQNGWHCSICYESVKDMPTVMGKADYDFCPNCGASMKGGAE